MQYQKQYQRTYTTDKINIQVKYCYLIHNYQHSLLPICTQCPFFFLTATSSTFFLITNSSHFSLTLAQCVGECMLSIQNIKHSMKDHNPSKSDCNTKRKLITAQVYEDSLILLVPTLFKSFTIVAPY